MTARLAILLVLLASISGWLTGCGPTGEPLDAIQARGELRFITRNSPTTYYLGRDGPRGFEYDLAAALATRLDVELVVIQAFTLDEMFQALERGEADIAGGGLTLTPWRVERYPASQAYAHQTPQLIYKAGETRPRTVEDLEGMTVAVLADSSHEQLLEKLAADGHDGLKWQSIMTNDPLELLMRVVDDRVDVAIADSRDFFVQQNLVPRLKVAFDLGSEQEVVWYLGRNARESALMLAVNEHLQRSLQEGRIDALSQHYFDRDDTISRIDSQTFVTRVREDLNDYRQLIEIVAREQNLPWELLAAISYQESHWDPNATSRTGVRGMMMLTRGTAKEMGVTNRTDPGQSLRGGARYFRKLRRRLPDDIHEPDRSWLALAAYNIGMGHLEDARVLAERRGGDPHRWEDVMNALPLLEESAHYATVRYGYARGMEAVRYVQNIRHYYNILRWQTARTRRPTPPTDVQELLPPPLQALSLPAL